MRKIVRSLAVEFVTERANKVLKFPDWKGFFVMGKLRLLRYFIFVIP